jgi:PadR family transcriptional regulator PadR
MLTDRAALDRTSGPRDDPLHHVARYLVDRSQLLKGTTTLLVLGVLRDRELYGYEIAQRIRERSGAVISPGEGWLYPALHRLEEQGLLDATWREGGPGPRRRYYRLTAKGRRALDAQLREWETFAQSVRLVTDTAAANG